MSEQATFLAFLYPAIGPLLGVIVGSFLTVTKDIFFEWRNSSRSNYYTAIRLVCELEKYAESCADIAEDDGDYDEVEPSYFRRTNLQDPQPPSLATDIDWKIFDREISYRVLLLPSNIEKANAQIAMSWDTSHLIGDDSFFFDTRQKEHSQLGLECLRISKEIQEKYKLPPFPKANTSTTGRLTNAMTKIDARERKLSEQNDQNNFLKEAP